MKKLLILFAAFVTLSLFSCRETTEMNTDGDMEKSDSGIQTREN